MARLTSDLESMRKDREILLDRLATLGLGGPLYNLPSSPDLSPSTESEEEPISKEQQDLNLMYSMRNRPSRLADMASGYMRKKSARNGPGVAWVPDASKMQAAAQAFEEAELQGRSQA